VNITSVSLIIFYAVITFIFTSIPEDTVDDNSSIDASFHIIEAFVVINSVRDEVRSSE
jgi:hypothetical protein